MRKACMPEWNCFLISSQISLILLLGQFKWHIVQEELHQLFSMDTVVQEMGLPGRHFAFVTQQGGSWRTVSHIGAVSNQITSFW